MLATHSDAETAPLPAEERSGRSAVRWPSRFATHATRAAKAGWIVTYGGISTSKPAAADYIFLPRSIDAQDTGSSIGHGICDYTEGSSALDTVISCFDSARSEGGFADFHERLFVRDALFREHISALHDVAHETVCWLPLIGEPVAEESDPLVGYERYTVANWDFYGAEPITAATLQAARRLLRILPNSLGPPDIAPGADGTIGFEWAFTDRSLRKLFIDIGPGNVWSSYWRLASGEKQTIRPTPFGADTRAVLEELFNNLSS